MLCNIGRLLFSSELLGPYNLYQQIVILLSVPLTRNKDLDAVVYHREGTYWVHFNFTLKMM